jgi:hypothetical protein
MIEWAQFRLSKSDYQRIWTVIDCIGLPVGLQGFCNRPDAICAGFGRQSNQRSLQFQTPGFFSLPRDRLAGGLRRFSIRPPSEREVVPPDSQIRSFCWCTWGEKLPWFFSPSLFSGRLGGSSQTHVHGLSSGYYGRTDIVELRTVGARHRAPIRAALRSLAASLLPTWEKSVDHSVGTSSLWPLSQLTWVPSTPLGEHTERMFWTALSASRLCPSIFFRVSIWIPSLL